MRNPWKKLSSKVIHENEWIKLIEDEVITPFNKKGIFFYVSKMPCPIIIPLTNKKEVYFVGQWRYPINKYSWEFPMGTVEEKENILNAAKRELLEETNLRAKNWKLVGSFYFANGVMDQIAYIYLATDLFKSEGISEETEELQIKRLSFFQIEKMIKENKITDGPTIAAYYKLKLYLKKS